jgi:glycosyltransferase involved in cell wall biosynthesis
MKLSILIAAYNVEEHISKCIKSCVESLHISDYEILVVNDGSTDQTQNLVEELSEKIPNLILINKINEGLGAARNTGLENAKGEYVWMLDGDDYLEPNAIIQVLNSLKSQKDIYAFNFNIVNDKQEILYVKYPKDFITKELTGSEYYRKNYAESYTFQFVFRKELFMSNKLRFAQRINMQDSEILPKIMYHAKYVCFDDFSVYNYVQHDSSFTNTTNPEKRLSYFKSIHAVDTSLEKFSMEIQNKDSLLYEAMGLKRESLQKVIFNHLVFFKYDDKTFKIIINYLRQNNYFPLSYKPKGKMAVLAWSLNHFPEMTKKLVDKIRK